MAAAKLEDLAPSRISAGEGAARSSSLLGSRVDEAQHLDRRHALSMTSLPVRSRPASDAEAESRACLRTHLYNGRVGVARIIGPRTGHNRGGGLPVTSWGGLLGSIEQGRRRRHEARTGL